MNEETISKLETLHNKIYKETEEYSRTQFVSRIVDLEHNWNELKKWLEQMKESGLPIRYAYSEQVLSKMQELEQELENEKKIKNKHEYLVKRFIELPVSIITYEEISHTKLYIHELQEENKELHNKIDEISNFIKENKIKRYRSIEGEDYDEEIVLDEDDICCLERIINDEYDYENR